MTKDEALKMAIEAWDNIDTTNQSNIECARNWFIEGYVQALEQPAQEPRLVSYAPDGSTCTLNIDGEEVYFNREQLEGKEFFERGKEIARWADKQVQEPVGKWESNCKCDFRTKLVGDGCRYCQPQDFIDRLLYDLKDCNERIDELEMKEWQGLTDDEIKALVPDTGEWRCEVGVENAIDFAHAIEQALKEKNNG